jgi:hypothetical protein
MQLAAVAEHPVRDAARELGVSVNTYRKAQDAISSAETVMCTG